MPPTPAHRCPAGLSASRLIRRFSCFASERKDDAAPRGAGADAFCHAHGATACCRHARCLFVVACLLSEHRFYDAHHARCRLFFLSIPPPSFRRLICFACPLFSPRHGIYVWPVRPPLPSSFRFEPPPARPPVRHILIISLALRPPAVCLLPVLEPPPLISSPSPSHDNEQCADHLIASRARWRRAHGVTERERRASASHR